jgi:putative tRNA adenosine deaminase-associated protein
VDEADSLDGLADALRSVAVDDQPVLAVVEHEDEWFAIIRVDGEEEPRLFVSDLGAASHGGYAEMLASAADVDAELEPDEDQDDDEESEDEEGEEPEPEPPAALVWAGEPDLLEDLGDRPSAAPAGGGERGRPGCGARRCR